MAMIQTSDYMNSNIAENYQLYEKDIQEKNIELSCRPIGVNLSITSQCNMQPRCVMCLLPKYNKHMSLDVLNILTEDLLPYSLYVTLTALGEPTVCPYITEIIDSVDGWVNLQTNGINYPIISKISSQLHEIYFSVDSPVDYIYRKIRGVHFDKVVESIKEAVNIRALKNENLFIRLDFVIMQLNKNYIVDFVDFARQLRVDGVSFTRLYKLSIYPEGSIVRDGHEFKYKEQLISIEDQEVKNNLRRAKLLCEKYGIEFREMQ